MNSVLKGMSIISKTVDRSIEKSFRREGSRLPFKKRKLFHAFPDLSSDDKSLSAAATCEDERIAALALVAAASTPLPAPASSFSGMFTLPPFNERGQMQTHFFIQDHVEDGRESGGESASELSDSHPMSPGNPSKRQRVHHPPLTAPLAGGCHGRTSRNNSYCRRQPCFNGSKYCKLHYQHYIVAGIRAPVDSANSDTSSLVGEANGSEHGSCAAHQDKRFTGLPGEVQCLATTTRGRACAYVRVNDTKYCYLHSDYDTNPPPRRCSNSHGTSMQKTLSGTEDVTTSCNDAQSKAVSVVRSDDHAQTPVTPRSFVSPSVVRPFENSSILIKTPNKPPSVTSEESSISSAWVTPRQVSVDVLESSNAPIKSEYPLLSSTASDKWFGQRVKIAAGPLANSTGRVVKWGNGWVTVRIPNDTDGEDGLLHNRRSIELYLLPDEPRAVVAGDADNGIPESTGSLTRSVTQDTETVNSEQEVPCVFIHKRSSVQLSESQAADPKDSHIDSVPTDKETDEKLRESVSAKKEALSPGNEVSSPQREKGTEAPSTPPKARRSRSPKVDEIPLFEMISKEGIKKQQLNLLFGTAALERGRRRIHKPSRYEDKAMIEKRGSTP